MAGYMQVPTCSSAPESDAALYTRRRSLDELPEALVRRLRSNAAASTSGCDSSDCAFCQMAAQGPFADQFCAQRYSSIVRKRTTSSSGHTIAESSTPLDKDHFDEQASHLSLRCVPDVAPASPTPNSPTIASMRSFFDNRGSQHFSYRPRFHQQPLPVPARLDAVAHCIDPQQGQTTSYPRRDMISSVEFSDCGRLIATGGISKQLRLYSLTDCFDPTATPPAAAPLATIRTPYKISALAWSPRIEGVVTIGDYDGQLSQVHVGSGHMIAEADAHYGRRVWSVAHSRAATSLLISTSDDKCARLWDDTAGMAAPVATITPPGASPVCGADFHPRNQHLAALASSDHCVYLYDTRAYGAPLHRLAFHSRPVSYVKFMGNTQLVSASTDGSLALWQLPGAEAIRGGGCNTVADSLQMYPDLAQRRQRQLHRQQWPQHLLRVFRGHVNERNFVGLSVLPEQQLIASGSETPRAFAYCTAWADPLASAAVPERGRAAAAGAAGVQQAGERGLQQPQQQQPSHQQQHVEDSSDGGPPTFVSGVCWQGSEAARNLGMPPILAAATSAGDVRVFALLH